MSPRSSGELIYSVIRFYSLNVFIIMLLQTILTQIFQLVDLNEDWKSRRKLSGGDVKVLRLWCLKPTFGFLLLPIILRLRNSCVHLWRLSWHTTQWEATVIFCSKSKAYMYVKILLAFYRVNYGNANFWFGPLNCKIFGIMFKFSHFLSFSRVKAGSITNHCGKRQPTALPQCPLHKTHDLWPFKTWVQALYSLLLQ